MHSNIATSLMNNAQFHSPLSDLQLRGERAGCCDFQTFHSKREHCEHDSLKPLERRHNSFVMETRCPKLPVKPHPPRGKLEKLRPNPTAMVRLFSSQFRLGTTRLCVDFRHIWICEPWWKICMGFYQKRHAQSSSLMSFSIEQLKHLHSHRAQYLLCDSLLIKVSTQILIRN